MSVSSVSSSVLSSYLSTLTGSDDSDSTVKTNYLDQAKEGTVLTAKEQGAAQAQLKAVILTSLLDIQA